MTATYHYDALGQLVRVDDPHENATWVYTYDLGGNILSKAKYTLNDLTSAPEVSTYSYGDANWKDKLTAFNGVPITYDAIGNPLNDGTWAYEWQAGRQLKKMVKSDTTVEFEYDHSGLRTQKKVTQNGVTTTTNYTLHGKLVTHMTIGSDTMHFFYDAQSRPAKVSFNGSIYTYIHNLQGDIVGILDSDGELVVEYKYDAWGKLLSASGTLADTLGKRNPFRYRGYVYDEKSGLYYLRSRYYNPERGRFINADTCMGWSSMFEKNLFVYCSNAPIVFSDSNGFSPEVTPSPSRPENWDTAFYTRMLWQEIKATVTRVSKSIVNKVKSVCNTVLKAVKNAALVVKVSQLTQHGGGVIKFNTGLKATCYTSEYWYRTNRPASSWGSFAFDAGLTASGAVAGKIPALSKISPYLEGIGIGMLFIDACTNLQIDQINRCIDSSGSIGWISWEISVNAAPIPTAWDSTTFTPGEWFGEIKSVEYFE